VLNFHFGYKTAKIVKNCVYIAIPVMDEPQAVSFVRRLALQTHLPCMVAVCVNQPKAFLTDVDKRHIADNNIQTLQQLQALSGSGVLPFGLETIDCCTLGTDEKHIGVGWARKYALDLINTIATPDDIMIWMDADTVYPDNYIEKVAAVFEENTNALALTAPYYHLTDSFDERQQIAALRYEVYMRSYLINLYRSGHPYPFTAIGSGIASTVGAYRKTGGLTPFKSGEDFYFIQKAFKTGRALAYCDAVTYPSIRASSRVFFGTGPAIAKGLKDDWKSYPIYPFSLFDKIRCIYQEFYKLWQPHVRTEIQSELNGIITDAAVEKFRANARTCDQFVKFCTEKFDALRTLQYLKSHYRQDDRTDLENLQELLIWCGQQELHGFSDISTLSLSQWQQIRQTLFEAEMHLRLPDLYLMPNS
jgi:hypothetical protein